MRQVAVVVAREGKHDCDRDLGNDFTCSMHAHLTEMRVRARKQFARIAYGPLSGAEGAINAKKMAKLVLDDDMNIRATRDKTDCADEMDLRAR